MFPYRKSTASTAECTFAIVLGILLIIMTIIAFLTFAYGAYAVYNKPISDVVAETIHTASGGTVVEVDGTGFQPNASQEVWMDPSFSSVNSSLFNPSACCYLGNVTTDANGNVALTNFSLPSNVLARISADGFQVHYVVVTAVNQSVAPPPYSAYSSDVQANYSASTIVPASSGLQLFVLLIVVQVPVSYTIGWLFIALWTLALIFFAMALNGPYQNIVGAMKKGASEGVKGIFSNSMFAVMALFTVTLWGQVILADLQSAGGIATGGLPPEDPLLTLLGYLIAPFREELGFRVIPIGVAALVILLAKGRVRDGIMSLWHPMRYLKRNDTPLQYRSHQLLMYILIAVSAVLFGLAHVLLGSGWDVGKIAEAASVGVAFGVLYYQYGFPAAVLIHWAFDYMLAGVYFYSDLSAIAVDVELYTILVALLSTIALIILLYHRLRTKPQSQGIVTTSQPAVVPQQSSPG